MKLKNNIKKQIQNLKDAIQNTGREFNNANVNIMCSDSYSEERKEEESGKLENLYYIDIAPYPEAIRLLKS